jgi:3-hydroxyisobutyrate dehydrogenase-like beta-hydroxyacid dehydrogenase
MRVAFLGLGEMGRCMARRLEAADVDLVVQNRSPGPTAEFAERGVAVAGTPSEAAAGSDVCLTMLYDGGAVEAVLFGENGVLSGEGPFPEVVADMSTIDVATSTRIAERASAAGVSYLRAPVSGNPTVVTAGNLTIMVSGDPAALERARPVLEAIGPKIFHLGDGEQARVMKLGLQIMIATSAQMMAETLALGEANGLERAQILEVLKASAVGSPFVAYKAGPLIEDDYTSTFSSHLMYKDLQLVIDTANAAGVPVPVAALVGQLVQGCIGAGMGEIDFMALFPRLQREAGLRDDLPIPREGSPA